jgi:CO dehydrogenase maturation factor
MKTFVTMGRGGAGKTSFVALMTKFLIASAKTPLLLVDADPDQNLAEMTGIDIQSEGKNTIAELLSETFISRGGTTVGIAPSARIENTIWERGLYEGEYFDFLSVGTKWIEGCYCLPDAALKKALGTITRNYQFILIDSPGGLEHLNRKIASSVDMIFDIMGPSSKSFQHVKRAHRIIREVGITFDQFYVIGGYAFPDELGERAATETGLPYLGKIANDDMVAEYVLSGRSLINIPDTSLAYQSVTKILDRIIND